MPVNVSGVKVFVNVLVFVFVGVYGLGLLSPRELKDRESLLVGLDGRLLDVVSNWAMRALARPGGGNVESVAARA